MPSGLRDPFNPVVGEFAKNIRSTKGDDGELRSSMQQFGWIEEFPAMADENGVVLVGHRRLQIAKELGIEPVIKKLADTDKPFRIRSCSGSLMRARSEGGARCCSFLARTQRVAVRPRPPRPAMLARLSAHLVEFGDRARNVGVDRRQLGLADQKLFEPYERIEGLRQHVVARRETAVGVQAPPDRVEGFSADEAFSSERLSANGRWSGSPRRWGWHSRRSATTCEVYQSMVNLPTQKAAAPRQAAEPGPMIIAILALRWFWIRA
jgi:hypothetical protein